MQDKRASCYGPFLTVIPKCNSNTYKTKKLVLYFIKNSHSCLFPELEAVRHERNKQVFKLECFQLVRLAQYTISLLNKC